MFCCNAASKGVGKFFLKTRGFRDRSTGWLNFGFLKSKLGLDAAARLIRYMFCCKYWFNAPCFAVSFDPLSRIDSQIVCVLVAFPLGSFCFWVFAILRKKSGEWGFKRNPGESGFLGFGSSFKKNG